MRVTESQAPLFVNTGVRIWNAKRVPVGSRFAKLAVPVSAPDTARLEERLIPDAAAPDGVVAVLSLILWSPVVSSDWLLDRRCLTDDIIDHQLLAAACFNNVNNSDNSM
jgi:hypothetical protein